MNDTCYGIFLTCQGPHTKGPASYVLPTVVAGKHCLFLSNCVPNVTIDLRDFSTHHIARKLSVASINCLLSTCEDGE